MLASSGFMSLGYLGIVASLSELTASQCLWYATYMEFFPWDLLETSQVHWKHPGASVAQALRCLLRHGDSRGVTCARSLVPSVPEKPRHRVAESSGADCRFGTPWQHMRWCDQEDEDDEDVPELMMRCPA